MDVVTVLIAATQSALVTAKMAQSDALNKKRAATAARPFNLAIVDDAHKEYGRCSARRQVVERRCGKQCAVALAVKKRSRWLSRPQE